jgi:glutathione S-transferase
LPHHWIVPTGYIGTGGELYKAGKRMIPVLQFPEGGYWADSTPLAYELEKRHPDERSIIPSDPGQAFLSHLIEDMADELLVAAMFDLRWGSTEDQIFCSKRQLSGWMSPAPKESLEQRIAEFIPRQTRSRTAMVQGDNHAILMELYASVLAVIEGMLDRSLFMFGSRPSLADFGLYAQLCQCAIDPSASAIMRATAARTYQWTQTLDDCSGVDGEWAAADSSNPAAEAMLRLIGEIYLPILLANARAIADGASPLQFALSQAKTDNERESKFTTPIGERTWHGKPDSYKLKCLIWLRRELADMPSASRESIRPNLDRHQCWEALQEDELSLQAVPPMAPF